MTQLALETPRGGTEFARFCIIGALGFLVDAGVLMGLIHGARLDANLARIVSILVAITTTWAAHRVWTFQSNDPDRIAEWCRYVAVSAGGGALNFLTYSALLSFIPAVGPLLALVAGSALALVANYAGSKLWAFRGAGRDAPVT